ncbi:hypothetical protein FCV25MIE_17103 [Fagus crenata]
MAFSFLPKQKFFILTLISIAIFCFFSGYADDNPGQMTAQAFVCFNNKLIYSGCDEAYRLNPSGNINVPPEAADLFCNGPCLIETQQVLNCINNLLSNFIFYNKVTIPDVRYALNAGCSNTNQRGNFNVGQYIEGFTSNANRFQDWISLHTFMLIIWLFILRLI